MNWTPADVISVIGAVAGVLIPALVVLVQAIHGEGRRTRTEVRQAKQAIEQHNEEARCRFLESQKPVDGDSP